MTLISKKRILFIIVMASIIITVFITVGRANNMSSYKKNNKNQIIIGLSLDSLAVERWQTDRDIFTAKAKELGADVIVQTANNDTAEQVNQIKYLIDENIDVLVVVPHDSEALANVVEMAIKRGIKVIAYDRIVRNANVNLYISFDNSMVGELMGKALLSKVPKGNYIVINGDKEDYNTHMVNSGFKKVLSPDIQNNNIKIVSEIWANSWKEVDAYNCVESALSKNEKIDAIMAGDDRLAEAAIQALAERRLAGDVMVVGQDAELTGCQRIVDGVQLMTVYKPIRILAQKAAEYAVKLAKGENIQANNNIYDGKQNVPFQMETPYEVDKANMMDTIVKDKFHSIEDIYRNIPKEEWPKAN